MKNEYKVWIEKARKETFQENRLHGKFMRVVIERSWQWHDRIRVSVYWKLCQKYGVHCADVLYKKIPDGVRVSEDENVEISWDRSIETTQMMRLLSSIICVVSILDVLEGMQASAVIGATLILQDTLCL